MQIATIASTLTPLAVLACPVGMGLMMWMMARGNRSDRHANRQAPPATPTQPASLELLREEQLRLSSEIDRLEGRDPSRTEVGGERQ